MIKWVGGFLSLLMLMINSNAIAVEVCLLPALQDNYIYFIRQGDHAIVVDPGEAKPVLEKLSQEGLTLTHILNTHHHFDHVGGNKKIKNLTKCIVIGPDDVRIPDLDKPVYEGERVTVNGLTFHVISVPGHTSSHIAFYLPEKKWLFCGDALFTGGCGRIFEGTPAQMLASLRKLMQLPKDTSIFCGHEYTLKNLEFAAVIEPNNAAIKTRLQKVNILRKQGKATIPETLEVELETNPFLRVGQPELKQALKKEDATDTEVFAMLRSMKDNF